MGGMSDSITPASELLSSKGRSPSSPQDRRRAVDIMLAVALASGTRVCKSASKVRQPGAVWDEPWAPTWCQLQSLRDTQNLVDFCCTAQIFMSINRMNWFLVLFLCCCLQHKRGILHPSPRVV